MSGTKVIFTYKRKRLSSCSGPTHVDVYNDLLNEAKANKRPDLSNEPLANKRPDLSNEPLSENKKRDPGDLNCVICGHLDNLLNCKSCFRAYHLHCLAAGNKHVCCGKQLVPVSGQNDQPIIQAEKHVGSSTSKITLGTLVLPESKASRKNSSEITSENICSNLPFEKGKNPIHKDSTCLDSSLFNSDEHIEGGLGSQLIEQDKLLCSDALVKTKLTSPLITFSRRLKRKANAEKIDVLSKLLTKGDTVEGMSVCISTCDTTYTQGISAKQSTHQKPVSGDTYARDMPSEAGGEVTRNGSHSATVALTHVDRKACAEDMPLVTTPSNEHVSPKIAEKNASTSSEARGTRNPLQDSISCSSNDPVINSSCNNYSKNNAGPAASSNSQITSRDGSALKELCRMKEDRADACVIDCNVAPESDFQEQAPADAIENPYRSNLTTGNDVVMHDASRKGVDGSRLDYDSEFARHLPATEMAPKSKYLQLFSEHSTHVHLGGKTISSCWEQGRMFVLQDDKDSLDQSSSEAPLSLGLSLPRPFVGQSSKHSPTVHSLSSLNLRTRDLFPNSSILKHKMLLDSIDSQATSMRGTGSSLDMFELCPNMWTEDELDFLWIGVRRHGRGNWEAMLRDPRLHFNPFRLARDLADRWELEQHKLLNESGINNPFLLSRPGIPRDCAVAETQLSLGDLYRPKEASFYQCNAQSFSGIRQPHRQGRSSSKRFCYDGKCSLSGDFNGGSVNASSTDGPAKNVIPHWLQDAAPISMSSRVQNLPGASAKHRRAASRRHKGVCPCPVDGSNDVIVIDSDASSEETISDEHNPRP